MVTDKKNFLGTRKPPVVVVVCEKQQSLLGPFSEIKFHKDKNKFCHLCQQTTVHILLYLQLHILYYYYNYYSIYSSYSPCLPKLLL